jgi:hypothetical protein
MHNISPEARQFYYYVTTTLVYFILPLQFSIQAVIGSTLYLQIIKGHASMLLQCYYDKHLNMVRISLIDFNNLHITEFILFTICLSNISIWKFNYI